MAGTGGRRGDTGDMPLMLRLAAIARSALRIGRWFAFASLLAGLVVLAGSWDARQPGWALLLAIVCLGPGVVLLHLVSVLGALPARLRFGSDLRSRSTVMLFGVGITYLLRPWYWSAVAVSLLATLVLLPLSVAVALGLA